MRRHKLQMNFGLVARLKEVMEFLGRDPSLAIGLLFWKVISLALRLFPHLLWISHTIDSVRTSLMKDLDLLFDD